MNRAIIFIVLIVTCLSACKKSDLGPAAEKAQAAIDDKIIADYLAANPGLNANKADTTGVYYIIEEPGTGNALFANSTEVTVGYTGKLLSTGQVFAQTDDFHPSFKLSEVFRGWRVGIPKIKKGGKVRLLLPSRYVYGPYPQPTLGTAFGLKDGLPAHAITDFTIQLYDIKN